MEAIYKMNLLNDMANALNGFMRDYPNADEAMQVELMEEWCFNKIQETVSFNVLYDLAPKCLTYYETLLWVYDSEPNPLDSYIHA
jgi:hypothetical protein